MINKSIAYRLSIFISLAVISVFIAFIIVSYISTQKLLKENIEHKAIEISSEIIVEVEKLLISTREITSNISKQILYYGERNDAGLLINGIMDKYPALSAIHINIDSVVSSHNFHNYLAYRENNSVYFVQGNNQTYHCEIEKKMTGQVIRQKKPGWTEPFRCPLEDDVVVSYYSPITLTDGNNHKIIAGEVICEISLLDINDLINEVKISERGFAFLISQKGDYITHPNKNWILNRNILTIPDKIYDRNKINMEEIIELQQSGTAIAFAEMLGFEKSWVYYSPVKENGWLLIIGIPYNELFEPLNLMILKMLLFSVLGILTIYFIITSISNKLVEPLSIVTTQLKKFSNLSGDKISDNTQNEIKLVSESLNYLKAWYDKYTITQSQEKKKNTRQMQDLIQASEIQQSLIKNVFPAFPDRKDIDLYALYKPAGIVSGDLFDYFFIDDENLVFTIGDVSGKGVPAAIFMSVSQTIIKSSTTLKKARNIVNKANRELYTNNQHQFFLTLFLGVLNLKTGMLNYCNAAHTSTLILKTNGEIQELGQSHGLPLGLYPDKKYYDVKVQIEKGDTLILYTDGITELQDSKRNHFGIDRFKESLGKLTLKPPVEITHEIEKSLDAFRGETKHSDDITLFVIRYDP